MSPFDEFNETKAERKARLKREKLAAKEAKAQAKADAKTAKAQAKADAKAAKAQGKAAEASGKTDAAAKDELELEAKLARYRQLRANVRNRRIAYVLIIVLAVATFLATAWDIVYNQSDFQWYLLPVYILLLVWGLLLLISRKRHLEEVAELEAMYRTYLECDHCKSLFQFGELNFGQRKRVGFTCPVCGEESALPSAGAVPVERVLPDARVYETSYGCASCNEQIVVGTFGTVPKESRFRACPNCGTVGKVGVV